VLSLSLASWEEETSLHFLGKGSSSILMCIKLWRLMPNSWRSYITYHRRTFCGLQKPRQFLATLVTSQMQDFVGQFGLSLQAVLKFICHTAYLLMTAHKQLNSYSHCSHRVYVTVGCPSVRLCHHSPASDLIWPLCWVVSIRLLTTMVR